MTRKSNKFAQLTEIKNIKHGTIDELLAELTKAYYYSRERILEESPTAKIKGYSIQPNILPETDCKVVLRIDFEVE